MVDACIPAYSVLGYPVPSNGGISLFVVSEQGVSYTSSHGSVHVWFDFLFLDFIKSNFIILLFNIYFLLKIYFRSSEVKIIIFIIIL